ncbi:hypothetical protein A2U01_0006497 [Trifolium medium]|uniref:Uncharacterized protein n=1 Tax=Trifolium medium TaxID=97028 RepID=A0A392MFX3_9FABA|nr:hypothetical protein [Trifolium medium]
METTHRAYVPYIPPRTASQPSDIQVSDDAPLLNHDSDLSDDFVKALKKKKKSTEMEIDVAGDSSSSKDATVLDHPESHHQLIKCSTSITSTADGAAAADDSVKASSKKKKKSIADGAADSVKAVLKRPKHESQFRKKKKQKLIPSTVS